MRGRARALASRALRDGDAHAAYVRDAANARAPPELASVLRVLEAQGMTLVEPRARRGIHPLVVPLAVDPAGGVTIGLYVKGEEELRERGAGRGRGTTLGVVGEKRE